MTNPESIRQELKRLQDAYAPQGETATRIRDISIGMIIGPTCVGKSTIIKEVTEIDPEFSNPGGFTTRELRPTDAKSYRRLDGSRKSLSDFLERVKRGEPVQYNVYDTGHIYGSEIQDYPGPYSVLDTQYSAAANLARAGFRSAIPIAIAAHPDQYGRQLASRYPDKAAADFKVRLYEAQKSLEWCLEQGEGIPWVINRPGNAEAAAREIIGLVRGYYEPLTSARTVGERLLKRVLQLNS